MVLLQDKQTSRFTTADLRARVAANLMTPHARISGEEKGEPGSSDFALNPGLRELLEPEADRRQAAVLIAVIERAEGPTVLFTKRSESLPTHAGQVSFPGGKMEASDAHVMETALRETREEIGLDESFIEPIGFLNDYLTATAFRISPLVAIIREGFTLKPDTSEVDEIFEVPFAHLMNSANHEIHTREFRGAQRLFYAMPYEGRFIWGATAGMLRNLYECLYSADARK